MGSPVAKQKSKVTAPQRLWLGKGLQLVNALYTEFS